MKPLLCLLLVSSPLLAQEQSNRAYDVSRLVLYSGSSFDAITTLKADTVPSSTVRYMPNGVAISFNNVSHEADSIYGQSPLQQVAVLGGLTVLADRLTLWMHHNGHDRLAKTLNYSVGAIHIGAGVWNIKAIQERH